MGLTTVQRYCAACDKAAESVWECVCVCVCLCLSVFRISQKLCGPISMKLFIVHRGHYIGRRERIKASGKFRPLVCKISENGAKLPTSRRSPRAGSAMACGPSSRARMRAGRWYDSGTGQSRAGLGAWPVAFHAGPSQSLHLDASLLDVSITITVNTKVAVTYIPKGASTPATNFSCHHIIVTLLCFAFARSFTLYLCLVFYSFY